MSNIEKNYLLITTPLDQLMDVKKEKNIVYLGPKGKDVLKKNPIIKDLKIIGTTWANREEFYKDISYINNLYGRLLVSICNLLNKTFDVKNTQSYWQFYVGTNIFYIIVSLYERWQRINYVSKNFKILETVVINFPQNFLLKKKQAELIESLCNSDLYNHILYSKIISHFSKIKIRNENYIYQHKKAFTKNKTKSLIKMIKKIKIRSVFNLFKKYYLILLNFLYAKLFLSTNEVFISDKVSKNLKNKIYDKLQQKRVHYKFNDSKKDFPINHQLREQLKKNFEFQTKNEFEIFLKDIIWEIIPLSILEGYKTIIKKNKKINETVRPKVILMKDDELLAENRSYIEWLACNKGRGTKFISLQAGGGTTVTPAFATVDAIFEKNFDIRLHYGKENFNEKFVGVGFERVFKDSKTYKPNLKGNIILTLFTPYGYSGGYLNSSQYISEEWNDYMTEQCKFLDNLPDDIRKNILIRLKKRHLDGDIHKDYFDFEKLLRGKYKSTNFDDYSTSLMNLSKNSKLIISTYNATTFLETMASNFPTMMYFPFSKFKISEFGLSCFKPLYELGILHESSKLAAQKLREINQNIEKWWYDKKLQNARLDFCKKLAYSPDNAENFFVKKFINIAKHE